MIVASPRQYAALNRMYLRMNFHAADLINEVIRGLDPHDPIQAEWAHGLITAADQLAELVAAAWPAAEVCDHHSDAACVLREVLRLHFPDPREDAS